MKYSFLNIHEAVILITVVETLLLCLALKFLLDKRPQPRRLLTSFFLMVAATLSTTMIVWNGYMQEHAIAQASWPVAVLAFSFLMEGPLLYVYLRSLSEHLDLSHWRWLIHLIAPTVVALTILATNIRILDWLPWNWELLAPAKFKVIQFTWGMFKSWPLVYVVACIYMEYKLRRQMSQVYSNISAWELRWADIILAGFFIHWFWAFVAYLASDYISDEIHDVLGIINNYFTAILVNVLFVYAMVNGRKLLAVSEPIARVTDTKTAIHNVEDKVQQIELAIQDKQIYLNSQMNLERFAEHCGLKPRDISAVLNRHYGKNFFEFINELRVNEVKEQLLAHPNKTILDIATEAGFNSQSAFQRFFKRLVGMTPSEYRRQAADTGTNSR